MNIFFLSGIILSLTGTFFFLVMEKAYQSANKLQMQVEGKLEKKSGRLLSFFAKHPAWFVGTTRVGSTLSIIGIVIYNTLFTVPLVLKIAPASFSPTLLVIPILVVVSSIQIIFVMVMLPSLIRMQNPNSVLSRFEIPFGLSFIILLVLTTPVVLVTRWITVHMLKKRFSEEMPYPGITDMKQWLLATNNAKPEAEDLAMNKKILLNALEFKTVKIRECMIPRTEITAAEITDSIEKLQKIFVDSGHSKVIIYKESIDDIVGYCHSSSLFKKPKEIEEILTPIIIVAETALANELMIRFINEHKSLAVVVDEFGGTSGIVSMEDVIEEIFGEIEDEHDEDDLLLVEQKLYENTYLISARLEIDYLNETYSWGLPTGEYETLGGLILSYAEDFPKQGQIIHLPPFTITIQTTGQNRIKTVIVEVAKEGKSSAD